MQDFFGNEVDISDINKSILIPIPKILELRKLLSLDQLVRVMNSIKSFLTHGG